MNLRKLIDMFKADQPSRRKEDSFEHGLRNMVLLLIGLWTVIGFSIWAFMKLQP